MYGQDVRDDLVRFQTRKEESQIQEGTAPQIIGSIQYETDNGSALEPLDYISTFGSLDFLIGENTKTFEVTIVDDSTHENDETVMLYLHDQIDAPLESELESNERVAILTTPCISMPVKPDDDATSSFLGYRVLVPIIKVFLNRKQQV